MPMDDAHGPSIGPGGYSAAGSFMDPVWRDQMDARRSMWRRTPEAEYPDGYLGTITGRRQDRLIQAIGKQMNRRVYDRGVHKGERIDQSDYFWPADQDPMRGLAAQAYGVRQVPIQTVPERMIVNDGKALPYDNAALVVLDPNRRDQLKRLSPRFR
jgi:hypothetical protein